jgi:hypothetical protein
MSTPDPSDGKQTHSASQRLQLEVPSGQDSVIALHRPPPILTIPNEITMKIFTHCLPDSISPPNIDVAPLLLGRVCRDWRIIAHETPELWTSLKIGESESDAPVEFIENWLSRARNLPLSLKLNSIDSRADTSRFINVLERHAHRWGNMELGLPFREFCLFKSPLQLPMLYRLNLDSDRSMSQERDPIFAAWNAPALRHLNLGCAMNPEDMQLPWVQLISLELHCEYMQPEHFLNILRHAPNIVDCVVEIYLDRGVDRFPQVPPCMFLTSLSFRGDVTDILDNFSAPALQVLDLEGVQVAYDLSFSTLRNFLSKSGCQLRELVIRVDESNKNLEDLLALLETLPMLEKLEVVEGHLPGFIAMYRRLSDGSPFLPRLRSLTASPYLREISITSDVPTMLNTLVDALSTRWVAPRERFSQILDVTLGWSGNWPILKERVDRVVASFRPQQEILTAVGINISVKTFE